MGLGNEYLGEAQVVVGVGGGDGLAAAVIYLLDATAVAA